MNGALVVGLIVALVVAGVALATVVALLRARAAPSADVAILGHRLDQVTDLVTELERHRGARLEQLAGVLEAQDRGIVRLAETTQQLREALSSSRARGQWGERMAEDVLALAGFVEEVQYRKQRSIVGGRGIPDFTFLLPRGQVLYMDVKFPFDNYVRYLDATTDDEREQRLADFLRDVRAKVSELAGRDYASADPSLGCVLLFIPNESLFAFIQEHDARLLDDALRRRIVCCSPLTLFAVLAVVRQAVDAFQVESTAHEILGLLDGFSDQWGRFVEEMEKVGRRLDDATKAHAQLTTVRRRKLERSLERIDDLRRNGGPASVPSDSCSSSSSL